MSYSLQLCLSADVWNMVSAHLKPRHLLKLMCTNKNISKAVDCDKYWERIALHLLWRDDGYMGISMVSESEGLRDVYPGLFHFINLPSPGYLAGVEEFIRRVRVTLLLDYTEEEERLDFAAYKDAPLCALVRLYERYTVKRRLRLMENPHCCPEFRRTTVQGLYEHCDYAERLNMKGVAKREVMIYNAQLMETYGNRFPRSNQKWKEFEQAMEDDPMPMEHKTRWADALAALLWTCAGEGVELPSMWNVSVSAFCDTPAHY